MFQGVAPILELCLIECGKSNFLHVETSLFPLFCNYLSAAQWVIIRLVLESNLGASELIPVIQLS